MTALAVLAGMLGLLGAALVALAGLGLIRLPDPLTRATAVSKAASLGAVLVLLAVLLADPQPRTAVVIGLILVAHLVTSPLSGLALGRAAYRSGTARPPVTRVDEPATRARRPGMTGPHAGPGEPAPPGGSEPR
ncbi:MAG: monovalent cation/H(+) antiporter subunit G [Candidatus Nanopelagicales bacterium]|jgi:multicomponent Na+:H+ antiporter subunit G|nr:monovalent cation/H(+) antiporter subunit G [Candidatus Nanopelagicales bacterium]